MPIRLSSVFRNRGAPEGDLGEAPAVGPFSLATTPANGETVGELFETILGRRIDEDAKAEFNEIGSVKYWVERLVSSEEFFLRFTERNRLVAPSADFVRDEVFRTPDLTGAEPPNKVLVVGSCMVGGWKDVIEDAYPQTEVDYKIFNNASELEAISADEANATAFQITQLPLRSIVSEREYYSLHVGEKGRQAHEDLFQGAIERLRRNLDAALKYNRQFGLTTFVLGFARPQANPLGRLAPKYDLTNFSYFVGELNRVLCELIAAERNVHMIDFDEIASSLGKRFILDDSTMHLNHASFLASTQTDDDLDLTPHGDIRNLFAPRLAAATLAVFHECLAAYRVLEPTSKIKLVIFDLDGTLWRGVAAEQEELGSHINEGWPLGVLEAAAFLRKRGVLLAIASKNDPEIAARIWDGVYGDVFPLSNFAVVKFSWNPKTESIAEILSETNLLAGNVLFVDDNPVERERAQLAFPELRVLEGPVSTWRRTLLWAAELQTPYITDEAINRADTIRSMKTRETLRGAVSEADYLASLAVRVEVSRIDSLDSPGFKRAFELLNKTNQFNTTGRRWAQGEIEAFFKDGGYMMAARVADRLSDYGLTALALCQGARCEQMVMSCRVFGLGVESRMLETFQSNAGGPVAFAYHATDKNGPARTFLETFGLMKTAASAG